MKVINPTKDTLKVQINGNVYEVKGEDSLSNVPEAYAQDWKAKTHNFIILEKDDVVKSTQTVESPITPMAQVAEDKPEQEETIEDKPTEDTEYDGPDVAVEMSYSDMQKKASKLGMEKVIGVSKDNLIEFIKDNS